MFCWNAIGKIFLNYSFSELDEEMVYLKYTFGFKLKSLLLGSVLMLELDRFQVCYTDYIVLNQY